MGHHRTLVMAFISFCHIQFTGEKNREAARSDNAKDLPNPSTTLLDLNDDCLYAIFDLCRISMGDLCSLTRTCTRLKEIGTNIFNRRHNQTCDLRNIEEKTSVAVVASVMQLFGSRISTLHISLQKCLHPSAIIDSINRHCNALIGLTIESYEVPDNEDAINGLGLLFQKLTKLHLKNVNIGLCLNGIQIKTANGTLINFFSKCLFLRKLRVEKSRTLERVIFESFFPKLENFAYNSYISCNIEGFVLRHNSLKRFTFLMVHNTFNNFNCNLETFTIGCKDLEKFKFGFHTQTPNTTSMARCLARLQCLRLFKLESVTVANTIPKLVEVLPVMLEGLDLCDCRVDSALMPAILHLTNLRFLRLRGCKGSLGVDHIGQLTQLTGLSIGNANIDPMFDPRFDLIKTVNNSISLRKIKININGFEITESLYRQLIGVIENRTDVENRYLEIKCSNVEKDFVYSNCRTVKIKSL